MPTGLPCHREPSIVLMSMIGQNIIVLSIPYPSLIFKKKYKLYNKFNSIFTCKYHVRNLENRLLVRSLF